MVTSDSVWWELQARGLKRASGRTFSLRLGARRHHVSIKSPQGLTYQVLIDGEPVEAQLAPLGQDVTGPLAPENRLFRIQVGGRWLRMEVTQARGQRPQLFVEGQPVDVELVAAGATPARAAHRKNLHPQARQGAPRAMAEEAKRIAAAMPGRIVAVSVQPGQRVLEGQEVCVLEAMKMEQIIRSPADGVVKAVPVMPGQTVYAGDLLVELE